MSVKPVDINPTDLTCVKSILSAHLQNEAKVWVFGSRATWTTKDSSDLDLAIDAGRPLTRQEECALADAFDESDLPYKVDIVDLQTASESFKTIIERDMVELERGYKSTTLGEYVSIQGGFAFKSNDFSNIENNRVIKIKNIRHGFVDYNDTSYVSDQIKKLTKNWLTKPGDILISMTGSGQNAPDSLVGRVAKVYSKDPQSLINQRIGRLFLKNKDKIDIDFVFYFLSQRQTQNLLVSDATGSANQVNISAKTIESLDFPSVSFEDSKYIAHILNLFEWQIKNLKETNATLESIAQTLFKSWFINFDPVHAKQQGRLPDGMDAETAALFPDSFETSELGEIPKGWNYVSLREVVTIYDSKRIPLSGMDRSKRKGIFPYYGAAALMDWVDDYLFDGVYLLTGEDGSVADINGFPIIQYVWGKIWVNNHAHVLQGKDEICTEHVMLSLKQTNINPFITGAVQAKISQANMWRINFLRPSLDVSEKFTKFIEPLFTQIRHNTDKAQTLSKLRDILLPRLISGRLRIKNDEQQAIGKA